jgi:hypothetical protein
MYSVAQIAEMTTSTGTVRYLNYPNRRAHDMVSHDLEVEPGVKVGIYFDDILFDGAKVSEYGGNVMSSVRYSAGWKSMR